MSEEAGTVGDTPRPDWLEPGRVDNLERLLNSMAFTYRRGNREVKGAHPLESWVIKRCAGGGEDLHRLLAPWMSSFGLARLLVYLGFLHRRTAPLVVVSNCQRLGVHLRALRSPLLGPVDGHMLDFHRWDRDETGEINAKLDGGQRTQVLWVKNPDDISEIPEGWGRGLTCTWMEDLSRGDEAVDLSPLENFPYNLVIRTANPRHPETGDYIPYDLPPEDVLNRETSGPPEDHSDIWWLHEVRLKSARMGREIRCRETIEKAPLLEELCQETSGLTGFADGAPGFYFHCLRRAVELERDLHTRIEAVGSQDTEKTSLLREWGSMLGGVRDRVWTGWVDAYHETLEEYSGRRLPKVEWMADGTSSLGPQETVVLRTRDGVKDLARLTGWSSSIRDRISAWNEIDWLRVLREGEPDGLPEDLRENWRPIAHLPGVPRRQTLERLLRGLFGELRIWCYPHEASRLKNMVGRYEQKGLTSTSPSELGARGGGEGYSDDDIESLLEWEPPSAGRGRSGGSGDDQLERKVLEVTGEDLVLIEFDDGETRRVSPHRRMFVVSDDIDRIKVRDIEPGDVVVEAPHLADRSGDFVKEALSLDPRFERIRDKALEWRAHLLGIYDSWFEDLGVEEEPTFSEFHRQRLPSVNARTGTVIDWLNEETETPHWENLEAVLSDLGLGQRERRRIKKAQRQYRSLRQRAYIFIRNQLVRVAAEASGKGDDDEVDGGEFEAFRDLLLAHLEDVRFHQVERMKPVSPEDAKADGGG